MRVFLYEFVSGGGFFHPSLDAKPHGSLLTEGVAMWNAIYQDLSSVAEVFTTRDNRLATTDLPPNCQLVDSYDLSQLSEFASECDFSLLIAPEFDEHLFRLAEHFEKQQCRLLSPNTEFIQLTSSKSATAKCLSAAGVATPPGETLAIGETLSRSTSFPAVVKVNDGAGSMGEVVEAWTAKTYDQVMRVEPYVDGLPCSQSFLCRSSQPPLPCPAMYQHIAADGSLSYIGGERLVNKQKACRVETLAETALKALPKTIGYVGVDIILGDSEDGSEDCVVEVNPRLTTSYLGIRDLSEHNLAQAMINIAEGREPCVSFDSGYVRFNPAGSVNGYF